MPKWVDPDEDKAVLQVRNQTMRHRRACGAPDSMPFDVHAKEQMAGRQQRPPQATRQTQQLLRFLSASSKCQHPVKRQHRLVDADVAEESATFLGVCDGASEVQRMGIPPEELPRELLQHVRRAQEYRLSQKAGFSAESGRWVVDMIEDSYNSTKSFGATTLLLACLDETNRLMVANIGNSSMLLLRPSQQYPRLEVIFKTDPSCFDGDPRKPLQLMRLRDVRDAEVRSMIRDTHVDALDVRDGDMLVLGSDGVFDNLVDADIVRIVSKVVSGGDRSHAGRPSAAPVPHPSQLKEAADLLVSSAIKNCCARKGQEASSENIHPNRIQAEVFQKPRSGGHPDDTTAIVALIVDRGLSAARERAALPANESFLARPDESNLPSPARQPSASHGLNHTETSSLLGSLNFLGGGSMVSSTGPPKLSPRGLPGTPEIGGLVTGNDTQSYSETSLFPPQPLLAEVVARDSIALPEQTIFTAALRTSPLIGSIVSRDSLALSEKSLFSAGPLAPMRPQTHSKVFAERPQTHSKVFAERPQTHSKVFAERPSFTAPPSTATSTTASTSSSRALSVGGVRALGAETSQGSSQTLPVPRVGTRDLRYSYDPARDSREHKKKNTFAQQGQVGMGRAAQMR